MKNIARRSVVLAGEGVRQLHNLGYNLIIDAGNSCATQSTPQPGAPAPKRTNHTNSGVMKREQQAAAWGGCTNPHIASGKCMNACRTTLEFNKHSVVNSHFVVWAMCTKCRASKTSCTAVDRCPVAMAKTRATRGVRRRGGGDLSIAVLTWAAACRISSHERRFSFMKRSMQPAAVLPAPSFHFATVVSKKARSAP